MAIKQLFFVALILGTVGSHTATVHAGCGCDKPPPTPAAAVPHVAFAGMPVTFFDSNMHVGQTWTVTFEQHGAAVGSVTAPVVSRRDLTNPSSTTSVPQLVVTLPELPAGPTRAVVSTTATGASFIVPEDKFTAIAKPVMVAEQDTDYSVDNYATGIGTDGTVYVSVGGLNGVCEAMEFRAVLPNYPLRVTSIAILNAQGFFIDALQGQSAPHFQLESQQGASSDILHYFRHSFAQYCLTHLPGGAKEVDPTDPHWHRDGTPHVDYSTLIFAFSGQVNGTTPSAGNAALTVDLETQLGDGTNAWEVEREEEITSGDDDDDAEDGDE
ncbi:MAG: hypothetical protein HOP18_25505 [Deltaproteobacteria bacterium]|nr:hypothetical protein [Deltaproteobacteria bacterium]